MSTSAALSRATCLVLCLVLGLGGCSIQTAGAPKGDLTLEAVFSDVQTLVVGHSVQIADVRVGTVTAIDLDGWRARVRMSIKNGRRIPTGTTATIARTSLLGENYVRLNLPPGRDLRSGPALADGATIGQTSVQPDLELVTERAGPLLAALGGQDLGTLIDTGAQAFGGQGERLNRMIAQVTEISRHYAAASDDLARLLDGLGRLGRNLAAGSPELDRLPDSVNLASERLLADRKRLRAAIVELTRLAETFNTRVHARHGARLKVVLDRIQEIIIAANRGREDLQTLAEGLLGFLRAPSVSFGGQGMQYVWLAGLLPPRGLAQNTGQNSGRNTGRPPSGSQPGERERQAGELRDLNRIVAPPS